MDEDKKPVGILIKKAKTAVNPPQQDAPKPVPAKEEKPLEKKKIVVVRKKVVVVKKAPENAEPETKPAVQQQETIKQPVPSAPQKETRPKPEAQAKPQQTAKPQVSLNGFTPSGNQLHKGPIIIKNTNLPPLSPKGSRPVPSNGPRVVGTVSGKHNGYGGGNGFQQGNGQFRRPGAYGGKPGFQNREGGQSRPPFGGQRQGGFGQRPGFNGSVPRPGAGFGGGQRPPMSEGSGFGTKNKKNFTQKKGDYRRDQEKYDEELEFKLNRHKSESSSAAVPKSIDIMPMVTPGELAKKMNLKASEIIQKLFAMGMMVTINQQIDSETASIIASEYGCETHIVDLYEETVIESDKGNDEDFVPRAPIVTVMGHVDHGKTKLLDAIRSSHVADKEFGGITQHIGAYKVSIPERGDIVFLDTPGHAAFTMMRARGAQVTDIVVLVVAANDGVMPQTLEAIDHAKAAKVPIIVAVNKCDLPEANPDRVKQQLSDHGLVPEDWGGTTLFCNISALKKQGIDELLDTILLQAEMLELKANPKCRAEGKVLESRIDPGRGVVATVLVQNGTLNKDDYFVAGIYPGHARTIFDDKGKKISSAGPSTPVEITGLSDIPSAGDPFQVTEDERQARTVGAKRQELERLGQSKNYKKVTLDNLYEKIQEGEVKEFNVIIKGDVQGSVEALQASLEKLSTPEIRLNVLRSSAGAIIENDVNLASASDNSALIIGFNVRPTPKAQQLAEQEKIEIRKYNVIYDVVEDVKAAMEGMLTPDKKEIDIGKAEVRDTFRVPKVGVVAGCYVLDGKVTRKSMVRVIRENIQISQSLVKISSLKRFKDDAKEVASGFECGIGLENYQDIKVGDILEIVDVVEIKKTIDKNIE